MRKIMIVALLTGILAMASGCMTANLANPGSEPLKLTPESPDVSEVSPAPEEPGQSQPAQEIIYPSIPTAEEKLGNAEKNVYSGIEIDAFIRERKAILPGFAVPITVIVKNTGDELVDYVQGSGSYTIPDAVFIGVEGLQTVPSEDRLGVATMDFRVNELKPGEQIEFVMYVMATEPSDKFFGYAAEMYNGGGGYIADQSWDELQKLYPDLIPAQPGSYPGKAYFLYSPRGEGEFPDFTSEPSGYAECEFTIAVE